MLDCSLATDEGFSVQKTWDKLRIILVGKAPQKLTELHPSVRVVNWSRAKQVCKLCEDAVQLFFFTTGHLLRGKPKCKNFLSSLFVRDYSERLILKYGACSQIKMLLSHPRVSRAEISVKGSNKSKK